MASGPDARFPACGHGPPRGTPRAGSPSVAPDSRGRVRRPRFPCGSTRPTAIPIRASSPSPDPATSATLPTPRLGRPRRSTASVYTGRRRRRPRRLARAGRIDEAQRESRSHREPVALIPPALIVDARHDDGVGHGLECRFPWSDDGGGIVNRGPGPSDAWAYPDAAEVAEILRPLNCGAPSGSRNRNSQALRKTWRWVPRP